MDWLEIAQPRAERLESFRGVAYLCPAGVWTLGFGDTDGVKQGDTTTLPEARARLRARLLKRGEVVDARVLVPLTAPQMAALVLLSDNIGNDAFRKSTLLRKLNAGDYAGAAKEFDRWVRGGGRVLPGLVKRRAEERRLFEGLA